MLKKLDYYVQFATGATFTNSIDFELGMTGVTGRNGKGKSLSIEMVQFALFGSKALRGKSEDYKKLTVSLSLTVKGQDYRIERTMKDATLYKGETPEASGTTPVNKAVPALFGYSYEVFQVANVANQGSIEKLGNMLPTERKRLVDETIGLNVLDALEKFIGESVKGINGEIVGMESAMSEPVKPQMPEGYAPSGSLASDLEALRSTSMEKTFLERKAAKVIPVVVAPEACAFDVSKLQEFQESEKKRQHLIIERQTVEREINKISDAPYTEEQLDLWFKQWGILQDHKEKSQLKARLEKEKVRHECPACQHEWFDQDPRLAELVVPVVDFDTPPLTTTQIFTFQRALPLQARKQELQAELVELNKQIEEMPVYGEAISVINQYLQKLEQYNRDQAEVQKFRVEVEGAKAALTLEKYVGVSEKLAMTEKAYTSAVTYEAMVAAYEKQKKTYDSLVLKVEEKKVEKASWEGAKKAVATLRARVKGYLLPSLNTVASALINQMTGGELEWIVVNEDFEITVHGQRLETLSGSGKAVANLALRIALGQVLTNKVFSVLMLDEIDASCDDVRAQYIAQCVRRLTSTIQQVVVISHKQGIEADHYVRF